MLPLSAVVRYVLHVHANKVNVGLRTQCSFERNTGIQTPFFRIFILKNLTLCT